MRCRNMNPISGAHMSSGKDSDTPSTEIKTKDKMEKLTVRGALFEKAVIAQHSRNMQNTHLQHKRDSLILTKRSAFCLAK